MFKEAFTLSGNDTVFLKQNVKNNAFMIINLFFKYPILFENAEKI